MLETLTLVKKRDHVTSFWYNMAETKDNQTKGGTIITPGKMLLKQKMTLLQLAKQLHNIRKACRMMGVSH